MDTWVLLSWLFAIILGISFIVVGLWARHEFCGRRAKKEKTKSGTQEGPTEEQPRQLQQIPAAQTNTVTVGAAGTNAMQQHWTHDLPSDDRPFEAVVIDALTMDEQDTFCNWGSREPDASPKGDIFPCWDIFRCAASPCAQHNVNGSKWETESEQTRLKGRAMLKQWLTEGKSPTYTKDHTNEIWDIVNNFAKNQERYKEFDGMGLVFIRSKPQQVDELIDFTSRITDQIIGAHIFDHFCSKNVDSHDGWGVIGHSPISDQTRLLSVGTRFRCDVGKILRSPRGRRAIQRANEPRTGFTTAVHVADNSDAVILKLGKDAKIHLFHKDNIEGEQCSVVNLKYRLEHLLLPAPTAL